MVTGILGIELISKNRAKSTRAFSLIEILLVIALLAVLAGVVSGNLGAFIKGTNFEPPDRVLKKAVLDAFYYSSERKRSTFLSYSEKNATFLVTDSAGSFLAEHPVYQKLNKDISENEGNLPSVKFHAQGPLSGLDGDDSEYDEKDLILKRIRFHSGSSVPFRAVIDFRDKEEKLFFDPFSGYVLEKE